MNPLVLEHTQEVIRKAVLALGGYELFGVELFVCDDKVIFSEIPPRPHDIRMVTLISRGPSEFALHVRAFLGSPVGGTRQYGPVASIVTLSQLTSQNVMFDNVQNTVGTNLQVRLLGKSEIDGSRHLGVVLATVGNVIDVIKRTKRVAGQAKVQN